MTDNALADDNDAMVAQQMNDIRKKLIPLLQQSFGPQWEDAVEIELVLRPRSRTHEQLPLKLVQAMRTLAEDHAMDFMSHYTEAELIQRTSL